MHYLLRQTFKEGLSEMLFDVMTSRTTYSLIQERSHFSVTSASFLAQQRLTSRNTCSLIQERSLLNVTSAAFPAFKP